MIHRVSGNRTFTGAALTESAACKNRSLAARLIVSLLLVSAIGLGQQIKMEDRAGAAGIGFRHVSGATAEKYLIETMGGGVAVLDYDGDGRLDLFFVDSGPIRDGAVERDSPAAWNRLYHNDGGGTFSDVTAGSGLETAPAGRYGMGVAAGDIDNDGLPDLAITGVGAAEVYRNLGDGKFERIEGFSAPGWSASAGFVDYDRDGLLDLFVTRYLDWDFSKHIECGGAIRMYCPPAENMLRLHRTRLFRNVGCRGSYRDVSDESGESVELASANPSGVAFNDADGDGDPDIVVANDAEPQQLCCSTTATGRSPRTPCSPGSPTTRTAGRLRGHGRRLSGLRQRSCSRTS